MPPSENGFGNGRTPPTGVRIVDAPASSSSPTVEALIDAGKNIERGIASWKIIVGCFSTSIIIIASVMVAGWRAREASEQVARELISHHLASITPLDSKQDANIESLKSQISEIKDTGLETREEIGKLRGDFYNFVTGNVRAIKPPTP